MDALKDKVALVTGGSKGIGFGIARSLLQEGAKVAITGRSADALKQAQSKLAAGSHNLLAIQADVRKSDEQQRAVGQLIAAWGKLDIVVANAGVGSFTSIDALSVDVWREIIDTNLTGTFLTAKASLDHLKKTKGYFITIGSLAGANFFAGGSAYNASKFGLLGFTQAAMLDLRPFGIKVSTIMPGSVATEFNDHSPGSADSWKIQPEDIGELVIDLLKMNPRTLPSKIEVRPSQPK